MAQGALRRGRTRIFLLSPANAGGERAGMLLRPGASFPLARAVQSPIGAPIGEVFRFASGLYFRGKLAYAERFARPPRGGAGVLVITAGAGLVAASTLVTADDLRTFARVPVDQRDPRYRVPLVRDLAALVAATPRAEVVLLGSIASDKYVGLLLDAFGDQLLFPVSFVGRGDMSRGGLLLRAVRAGIELECVPVRGAIRHGVRPPRLPRETRRAGLDPPRND